MKKWIALFAVMAISAPMTANAAFTGGDFETPVIANNSFAYSPTGGPLTFGPNSGIVRGSTAFGNPTPSGAQAGFLQNGFGTYGTITETFTQAAGLYTISLLAASRAGYPQSSFTITIDGNTVGANSPITTTSFTQYNSNQFLLSGSTHTIVFTATGSTGEDSTSFIDNVSLNAVVPEPSSVVMLGLGLVVSGGAFARKVRRDRAAA